MLPHAAVFFQEYSDKRKQHTEKDHRINHRIHPICLSKLCAKQEPGSSCQTTGRTRKSRQTDTRTARIAAYMHKKKISCYCKQCCPVLEQILPDPCSYLFHKLFYRMIFFGHFSAHAPQFVHFSGSIHARLFSTTIASAGQTSDTSDSQCIPCCIQPSRLFPFP